MANKNQTSTYLVKIKTRPRTVLGRVFLLEKASSHYFIPKSSPRLETERLQRAHEVYLSRILFESAKNLEIT